MSAASAVIVAVLVSVRWDEVEEELRRLVSPATISLPRDLLLPVPVHASIDRVCQEAQSRLASLISGRLRAASSQLVLDPSVIRQRLSGWHWETLLDEAQLAPSDPLSFVSTTQPTTPVRLTLWPRHVQAMEEASEGDADDHNNVPDNGPEVINLDQGDNEEAPAAPEAPAAAAGGVAPAPPPQPAETGWLVAEWEVDAEVLLSHLFTSSASPAEVWQALCATGGRALRVSTTVGRVGQRHVQLVEANGWQLLDGWTALTLPFLPSSNSEHSRTNQQLTTDVLSLSCGARPVLSLTAVYSERAVRRFFRLSIRLEAPHLYKQDELDRSDRPPRLSSAPTVRRINRLLAVLFDQPSLSADYERMLEGRLQLSAEELTQRRRDFYQRVEERMQPSSGPSRSCRALAAAALAVEPLPFQLHTVDFVHDRITQPAPDGLFRLPHFQSLPLQQTRGSQPVQLHYNPLSGEFSEGEPFIRLKRRNLAILNHMGTGKTLCALLLLLRLRAAQPKRRYLVVVHGSICHQWVEEIESRLRRGQLRGLVYAPETSIRPGSKDIRVVSSVDEARQVMDTVEDGGFHFILTTLAAVLKLRSEGMSRLSRLGFHGLVIDEAQKLESTRHRHVVMAALQEVRPSFVLFMTGTLWHEHHIRHVQRIMMLPPLQPFCDLSYWTRTMAVPFLCGEPVAQSSLCSLFEHNSIRFNEQRVAAELQRHLVIEISHKTYLLQPQRIEAVNMAVVHHESGLPQWLRQPALQRLRERLLAMHPGLTAKLAKKTEVRWANDSMQLRVTQQWDIQLSSAELRHQKLAAGTSVDMVRKWRLAIDAGHLWLQHVLHRSIQLSSNPRASELLLDVSVVTDLSVLQAALVGYHELRSLPVPTEQQDRLVSARLDVAVGRLIIRQAELRAAAAPSAQTSSELEQGEAFVERGLGIERDVAESTCRDALQTAHAAWHKAKSLRSFQRLSSWCQQLPRWLRRLEAERGGLDRYMTKVHAEQQRQNRSIQTMQQVWLHGVVALGRAQRAVRTAEAAVVQLLEPSQWTAGAILELLRRPCHSQADWKPRSPERPPLQYDEELDCSQGWFDCNAVYDDIRCPQLCVLCQLELCREELVQALGEDAYRWTLPEAVLRGAAMATAEVSSSEYRTVWRHVTELRGLLNTIFHVAADAFRRAGDQLGHHYPANQPSAAVEQQPLLSSPSIKGAKKRSEPAGTELPSLDSLHEAYLAALSRYKAAERLHADVMGVESRELQEYEPSKIKKVLKELQRLVSVKAEPAAGRQHNILLFSEFVEVLNIVEAAVQACPDLAGLCRRLPDAVDEQPAVLDDFNSPSGGCRVLLLTLRQGSEGLNLTSASELIFMEGLISEEVLQQALARIVRLGQRHAALTTHTLLMDGALELTLKYPRPNNWQPHSPKSRRACSNATQPSQNSIHEPNKKKLKTQHPVPVSSPMVDDMHAAQIDVLLALVRDMSPSDSPDRTRLAELLLRSLRREHMVVLLQQAQAGLDMQDTLLQIFDSYPLSSVYDAEHVALLQQLHHLGYEERPGMTRSNGDCMFDAIADQLALQETRDWRLLELLDDHSWTSERDNLSSRLRVDAQRFVATEPAVQPFRAVAEAAQVNARPWGDMLSLYALSELRQYHIRVISSQRHWSPLVVEPLTAASRAVAAERRELVIGHIVERHYVSVQRRRSSTVNQS